MVSSTNPGSTTTGHQILREAQQQHLARPGQTNPSPMTPRYDDLLEQTIDQNTFYNSTTIETLLQEQANLQLASPLESLLPQDSYMPRSAGPQSTTSHRGDSRQHSFQSLGTATGTLAGQTMMERSMSQPNLRLHTEQRPNTPAQQIQNGMIPLDCFERTWGPVLTRELISKTSPHSRNHSIPAGTETSSKTAATTGPFFSDQESHRLSGRFFEADLYATDDIPG